MFNRNSKRPTKAEAARMQKLKEMPCVACVIRDIRLDQCGPTEVHHLVRANKRLGHSHTVPLGAWHHRAALKEGYNSDNMTYLWGPSLAKSSKAFHADVGTDDELLARTNSLLEDL